MGCLIAVFVVIALLLVGPIGVIFGASSLIDTLLSPWTLVFLIAGGSLSWWLASKADEENDDIARQFLAATDDIERDDLILKYQKVANIGSNNRISFEEAKAVLRVRAKRLSDKRQAQRKNRHPEKRNDRIFPLD